MLQQGGANETMARLKLRQLEAIITVFGRDKAKSVCFGNVDNPGFGECILDLLLHLVRQA